MEWAVEMMREHGLWGIFAAVALEYACLPIPSEALLPLCGLAAAAANLPLAPVVAVSVAAALVGSSACYALGALGGYVLIEKVLGRFPGAMRGVERARAWRKQNGGLSVMVARVIPLVRTWVSFAAGLAGERFGTFLLYSAMGIIVWNTVLIGAGYALYVEGYALGATRYLPVAGLAVAAVAMLVRAARARYKSRASKRRSETREAETVSSAKAQSPTASTASFSGR